MKTIGLIMAGGTGTRLWPLSRAKQPKQLLKLIKDKEMINVAIDQCYPFIAKEDMYIVTNRDHADQIRIVTGSRLSPGQIFIEPAVRNTAPCILYSALKLRKRYGDAVVCIQSADYCIKNESAFQERLALASDYAASHDCIVTVGIRPTFPNTGYGYIKKGALLDQSHHVHEVEAFFEKPDRETAAKYLESGQYLWNSGMYVFRLSTVLDRFERYLPEMYEALSPINDLSEAEADALIRDVYPEIKPISIEKGIMEKEKDISVVIGDFGWSHIGSWNTLEDIFTPDNDGNIVKGDHVGLDTKNCVIFSGDKTVATLGISNVVIVNTPDSILVCSLDSVQNIQNLIEELKKQHRSDLL